MAGHSVRRAVEQSFSHVTPDLTPDPPHIPPGALGGRAAHRPFPQRHLAPLVGRLRDDGPPRPRAHPRHGVGLLAADRRPLGRAAPARGAYITRLARREHVATSPLTPLLSRLLQVPHLLAPHIEALLREAYVQAGVQHLGLRYYPLAVTHHLGVSDDLSPRMNAYARTRLGQGRRAARILTPLLPLQVHARVGGDRFDVRDRLWSAPRRRRAAARRPRRRRRPRGRHGARGGGGRGDRTE